MASMSKRTQARNERELHELLSLPGNSTCADCGAKNPAWASWNLGIFLCMRCASLHRKLGTHISKVKSLSMDTWSNDQVESMKRHGNNEVNKVYNPKNKKPDMPLDADEVDSAMERFIRKKYQEKSLADGRPQPPQRDDHSPTTYSRPQRAESPPPPLPPKKGKLFGFSLRTSSSALPLSRHDKKKAAKERSMDNNFQVPTEDYNSMSRMADARFEMTDSDLQKKLNMLLDMGFSDVDRNANLLRRLNGNVERTIATLVQLGPSNGSKVSATRPVPEKEYSTEFPDVPTTSKPPEPSYNPFTQTDSQPSVGLSMGQPQGPPAQQYSSNNPFGPPAPRSQTETGLEQSFQSMQVTQPLFPHSTGGYPAQQASFQDPRLQYSMTPPVMSSNPQQGYVASPAAISMNTNPFFQPAPLSTQSTGSNPFLPQSQSATTPSTSTNPFFGFQPPQPTESPLRQSSLPASLNPFGIPPSQQSQLMSQQQQQPAGRPAPQAPDFYGATQTSSYGNQNNPFNMQQQQQQQQQLPHAQGPQATMSYQNFQYGQPQGQQQQPQFQQFQQQQQQQQPNFQQYNQQPQAMMPQQTGRYDKNSIMALYNYPQQSNQQLASIPEPADQNQAQQQQQHPQQVVSPTPSLDIFGQPNALTPTKRSSTMPVSLSNMHSAGGGGNRNPFFTNAANVNANANATFGLGSPAQTNMMPNLTQAQMQSPQGIAARHTSRESMIISGLENGRHSPDAFASLSARYQ
ncbi:uncharacterized protein PV06_06270 [Exophiala oligosperma]|uniref:Arf-GAP domain-containing protein n=1 Tax=Exophiala oligosperma TaxID=215243 RepID=A0A0D2DJY7_9EURO|nr:uncharacterized protein PV06_06270 [Exophiala oligosperma]KIW42755.1 hypothetical protein PV06_06270 [Exophiala oligosperma]